MSFNLTEGLKIANQVVFSKANRNLTDVEVIVLKGAWEREEYDKIAAKHQYATSYISQDVAPKLWKLLTAALGEKVRKSNFKEALKRYWEKQAFVESRLPNVAEQEPISSQPQLLSEVSSIPIDHFYIKSIIQEILLTPGSLLCLQIPKRIGKTSLIDSLLTSFTDENYSVVNLSFEFADPQTHFINLNQFLRWFCLSLSRELSLPNQLDDYWDEESMGAKVSCTTYIEKYVLTQFDHPLILSLSDLDLLFPHREVCEDFLGLLRSWYEKNRNRPIWKKLRLVLVHGTEISMHLPINQSPFNVGFSLKLPELTGTDV